MKKLGFIMFILFTGIFINAKAQTTPAAPQAPTIEQTDSMKVTVSEESGDPIDKLVEKAINAKIGDLENDDTQSTGFVGTVLFLVIALPTLITFGAIVLIVFFSTKHKKEAEKARYDLYLSSMEAGQPLPVKFFEIPEKKSSNLKRGAIWLAIGLGIVIFGLLENESSLMGIGAIPAFVGAAYLLVYFIEKRNNNDTPAVNE